MFEMIFRRKWEAAHRLIEGENANSLCSQPHGHTWRVEITLVAKEPQALDHKANILVRFEQAKKTWHQWIDQHVDHSFMFNHKDPLLEFMRHHNPEGRHLVLPGDPTTEMIAVAFKSKLDHLLQEQQSPMLCQAVRIQETQTNSIRFSGSAQEHLPKADKVGQYWWLRADMSICDEN